jgi:hypothetical protein
MARARCESYDCVNALAVHALGEGIEEQKVHYV